LEILRRRASALMLRASFRVNVKHGRTMLDFAIEELELQ
jgi:hypothetical protein